MRATSQIACDQHSILGVVFIELKATPLSLIWPFSPKTLSWASADKRIIGSQTACLLRELFPTPFLGVVNAVILIVTAERSSIRYR